MAVAKCLGRPALIGSCTRAPCRPAGWCSKKPAKPRPMCSTYRTSLRPMFLRSSSNCAYPPAQVFAMFGDIVGVVACLPGASLTAPPKGRPRRRRDPRQARTDRGVLPGCRTAHARPRRPGGPHRRRRQGPLQPVRDPGRNPLPSGPDRRRRRDAGRSLDRLHTYGNAGAGRSAGAGARPRRAADRGIRRQSRPPHVGQARPPKELRPS